MTIAVDILNNWEDLSPIDKIPVLTRFKSLVIGNNDEKLKLLNNSSSLAKIVGILKDSSSDPELLETAAIIVSSLTCLPAHQNRALKQLTNDSTLIPTLIESSSSDLKLLEINLTTMINLVNFRSNLISTTKDAQSINQLLEIMANLLKSSSQQIDTLIIRSLNLIYFMSIEDSSKLIQPLITRTSKELGFIFKFTTKLNQKVSLDSLDLNYCKDSHINNIKLKINSELVSSLLFSLAFIIQTKAVNTKFKMTLPKQFISTITSLIKSEDYQIRLSSLNFFINYLEHDEKLINKKKKLGQFSKLFPSLIELIELEIYTTFSIKNQEYPVSNRNIFYPKIEMSPIELLSKICRDYPDLIEKLMNTNITPKFLNVIVTNHQILKKKYMFDNKQNDSEKLIKFNVSSNDDNKKDSKKIQIISSCFLALSVIGSNNDNYKNEIISQHKILTEDIPEEAHLNNLLISVLNQYCFYLKQFELNLTKFNESPNLIDKENFIELINLLNDDLFTNVLYLIRSLSRSVALLRTFFVIQLHIVKILIKIIKFKYSKQVLLNISEYLSIDLSSIVTIINKQVLMRAITLGIIANSILDFSSIRDDFDHEDLIGIVQTYISYSDASYDNDNSKIDTLENDTTVLLNCFSILRNYFYNEEDDHKKFVIRKISLFTIFENIINDDYSNNKIQTTCFNILRNLSCGSNYFSDKIPVEFIKFLNLKNAAQSETSTSLPFKDFWELITHKFNVGIQNDNSELLITLAYIIDHIVATTDMNREKVIEEAHLLVLFNNILKDSDASFDVKLAIVWIIINLTWQDTTSSGNDIEAEDSMEVDQASRIPSSMSACARRAVILSAFGFVDSLKSLIKDLSSQSPNIDLLERCKTAEYQLAGLLKHDISVDDDNDDEEMSY